MAPIITLEIPIFGIDTTGHPTPNGSAQNVLKSGLECASTVECNATASYGEGGLTPSPTECLALYEYLGGKTYSSLTGIKIMIRPRGPCNDGSPDFLYSDNEVDQMETDIKNLLTKCPFLTDNAIISRHSFIFGVLKSPGQNNGQLHIAKETCTRLIKAAQGLPCYFHRALDDVISSGVEWKEALSDLAECGFRGVLTSGGKGNAVGNKDRVWEMAKYMEGGPLELVVGGGVRSYSVEPLLERWPDEVGMVMLHSACLKPDGIFDGDEAGKILSLGKR